MTKDELIEKLAVKLYDAFDSEDDRTFEELPTHTQQDYRSCARGLWPLIVEFVARWLDDASPDDFAYGIPEKVWREEMG
jgi:hypothetical protein